MKRQRLGENRGGGVGGGGEAIKNDSCCSEAPHHTVCPSVRPFVLQAHLGERSCRGVKGESLGEGDTPSILAGEPEEEPTLLRLPSNRSEDRLQEPSSGRCATSVDNMVVVPWKSLLGGLSVSISPLRFRGPRMLGRMQLMGLWLLRTVCRRRVGLGMGLGVKPLLLTRICRDGEKHCFLSIPRVGEGAGDTGTKSIRFGEEDEDFSKSLSL